MDPSIYIVFGRTGEYSDRNEWPVVAYPSEAEAVKHTERANDWLRRRGWLLGESIVDRSKFEYGTNPYDPNCSIDYTGTDYVAVKLPLKARAPREKTKWLDGQPLRGEP